PGLPYPPADEILYDDHISAFCRGGAAMPERLRKFEPDELDDAQRAIYDQFGSGGNRATIPGSFPLRDEAGHLYGPPNAWLLNPALGEAFQVLGFNVRSSTQLPP